MEELVVMEALLNGGRRERIGAAGLEMSKLTSKQKQRLVDNGVIDPLVSMLDSCDPEAIEAAVLALLNLSYGSERNKKRIAKSRAMQTLVALLRCQRTQLVELASTTIFILSSCTGNRLIIASSGTIPLLVELLAHSTHYEDDESSGNDTVRISLSTQAKIDVISTLQNLSTCKQLVPLLVSSSLISYLLRELIGETTSVIVDKAMALLERIVSSSEAGLKSVSAAEGTIQMLVEMIEEGSPECKEQAVGILLLICQSCREKYRAIILREGVMPGLLQLSVEGTRHAKESARTLLRLLRECSNIASKSRELKGEILEQIMERIDGDGGFNSTTTLRLVEQMIAKLSS